MAILKLEKMEAYGYLVNAVAQSEIKPVVATTLTEAVPLQKVQG